MWFRKAAKQGEVNSMLKMGDMYLYGIHFAPSCEMAYDWYKQAEKVCPAENEESKQKIREKMQHLYCSEFEQLLYTFHVAMKELRIVNDRRNLAGIHSHAGITLETLDKMKEHADSCRNCGNMARRTFIKYHIECKPGFISISDECRRKMEKGYTGDGLHDFFNEIKLLLDYAEGKLRTATPLLQIMRTPE